MKFWRIGRLSDLIQAYRANDPAAKSSLEIILLYPGVRALAFHRVAHALHQAGLPFFPRLLSEISRLSTGIEIHPGAKLGRNIVIDHGMGIVIGETAEVHDGVLIYQGVTLGATAHTASKRHPTIERGAILGSGAKILGDIRIGERARVGANAVVLHDVPADTTVVGIPGRVLPRKSDHPEV